MCTRAWETENREVRAYLPWFVYVFTTKLLAICEQLFKLACINVLYGILLNGVSVYHELVNWLPCPRTW